MLMKVIVLGDLHGEFDRLNCLLEQEKPDVILQVGDFGYWPRLEDQDLSVIRNAHTRIYFCDGNNDDLGMLLPMVKAACQPVEIAAGINYMPRGSILTLEDGRRIMFIGGAQSIDRCRRCEGWDWFPEEIICALDIVELPEVQVDIVISHTCPEEFPIETYSRQECSEPDPSRKILSRILHRYQPPLWYFGHWHAYAQGQHQKTRWVSLGWAKHWGSWYRVLPPLK
jgi:hypothetical protein